VRLLDLHATVLQVVHDQLHTQPETRTRRRAGRAHLSQKTPGRSDRRETRRSQRHISSETFVARPLERSLGMRRRVDEASARHGSSIRRSRRGAHALVFEYPAGGGGAETAHESDSHAAPAARSNAPTPGRAADGRFLGSTRSHSSPCSSPSFALSRESGTCSSDSR
jgi:hypothetical protein